MEIKRKFFLFSILKVDHKFANHVFTVNFRLSRLQRSTIMIQFLTFPICIYTLYSYLLGNCFITNRIGYDNPKTRPGLFFIYMFYIRPLGCPLSLSHHVLNCPLNRYLVNDHTTYSLPTVVTCVNTLNGRV